MSGAFPAFGVSAELGTYSFGGGTGGAGAGSGATRVVAESVLLCNDQWTGVGPSSVTQ